MGITCKEALLFANTCVCMKVESVLRDANMCAYFMKDKEALAKSKAMNWENTTLEHTREIC